ncbi:MAG: hypothetical protein ACRDUY_16700 [Nitriliruptorales bacterium]
MSAVTESGSGRGVFTELMGILGEGVKSKLTSRRTRQQTKT